MERARVRPRRAGASPPAARVPLMPVITISRMYGSGGSEVAERVAQALGWALFDNAMIDAIAERSGLTRAEVTAQDERVPSMVERLAAALSLGSPEIMPPVPSGPMETTEERILAARTDALHVFCFSTRPALRQYVMEKFSVTAAEADRIVTDMNKQREQYVKRHWNRNWLAHENYHLCVNTGWLGLDESAELVVEAAQRRFGAARAV